MEEKPKPRSEELPRGCTSGLIVLPLLVGFVIAGILGGVVGGLLGFLASQGWGEESKDPLAVLSSLYEEAKSLVIWGGALALVIYIISTLADL
jgi:hypothetical protein